MPSHLYTQVVAALKPFVTPSAFPSVLPGTPRQHTVSSPSTIQAALTQYQHPPLGVPFTPTAMLPGHGSGSSRNIQVAIRCCDSEWSGALDVPLHQAVGTSAYSYLTLKQVCVRLFVLLVLLCASVCYGLASPMATHLEFPPLLSI